MSVIFKARMKCDSCDALAADDHANAVAARAAAQARGWADGAPGQDICPTCQPEPVRLPPANCLQCGLVHEPGECPE